MPREFYLHFLRGVFVNTRSCCECEGVSGIIEKGMEMSGRIYSKVLKL